ncbi:lipoprotein [Spiroplasma endosymbiont of Ammophila pubescens]|uniref:lipoprotein n=1 Tax=Spiroplasma endosymbiont of Ammophila pubescens TaxID=3066315 RepID=UPI0032B30370
MKKLLSIIGVIILITNGSSNLIACDNSALTSEKLAELKEKNSKIINGNKLEWIAPQEKPFDTVDNKYYFVVWRGDKNDNWRIAKFKNDNIYIKIDEYNNF